jgi:UPF0716 protein FxsA
VLTVSVNTRYHGDMFPVLALLFVVVPFVELYLLIQIGQTFGALPTVGFVILMGVAGAALAKSQGFATLARIQREMAEGKVPAAALLDGVLIIAASLLMITPGVLTDVVGVLLLVPPVRAVVGRALTRYVSTRVRVVTPSPFGQAPFGEAPFAQAPWRGQRGDVIDIQAEVRDVGERKLPGDAAAPDSVAR